jgi:hypothetical protein
LIRQIIDKLRKHFPLLRKESVFVEAKGFQKKICRAPTPNASESLGTQFSYRLYIIIRFSGEASLGKGQRFAVRGYVSGDKRHNSLS